MWTVGPTVKTADVSTGRSERVPEETVDLDALWSHAIDGLADSTVTPQQRAWLRTTRPLGLLDGTALLAAPNEFTKDVLETRLRPMITTTLSELLGREIRVAVTVEPPADEATVLPTAAACAKRFPEPMTKVSKVYFGFSRAGSTRVTGRPVTADGGGQ